jgi:hypothetical protein
MPRDWLCKINEPGASDAFGLSMIALSGGAVVEAACMFQSDLWGKSMKQYLVGISLVAMSVLTACATKEEQSQRLYDDLSFFADARVFDSDEMRRFFAEEASAAGVVEIRAMRGFEKPRISQKAQTGCGRARLYKKEVLIDVDRGNCINLSNLAHEIAHIPAARAGCKGHDDRFYRINEEIARRFEERFPGKNWGNASPVERVRKRSREYRSAC